MKKFSKEKIILVYIFLSSIFFLLRVIFFAFSIGGIEMDSGWHLGVARILAERGIYASYANTIVEEGKGSFPSIHGRFSVQDDRGFSYFPAAVSAGPGYVVPEALLIKLFGNGFWQFRFFPLIAFLGMLILLFYFVNMLGGFISLVIFQLWLWIFPQIYLSMAYEAYGEHIALFYLLLSFWLVSRSKNSSKHENILMVFSGVAFSFSVMTKFIAIWSISSFGAIFFYDLFYRFKKRRIRKLLLIWSFWFVGFVSPIVIFEAYRFISLVSGFGIEGWKTINKDTLIRFKQDGSGLALKELDFNFVKNKAMVWGKAGFKYAIAPWIVLTTYLILFIKGLLKRGNLIFLLIFSGTISSLTWFILISPTGWTRHAWIGLVLGLVLIFSFFGRALSLLGKKNWYILGFVLIFFNLTFPVLSSSDSRFSIPQQRVVEWESKRYVGGLQGLPTNSIYYLPDQRQVLDFFNDSVKPNDRVYFFDFFLNSEISAIVGKVFFPIARYKGLNPADGKSYAILGPYQKGRLSLVGKIYHSGKIASLCERTVFENDSYTLCLLKK